MGPTPTGTATMEPAPTATMVPTTEPEYDSSNAQDILFVHCSSCHNPMTPFGNLASVDIDDLIVADLIVPGSADDSMVVVRMRNREMPPVSIERQPSDAEIEVVADYIDSL
jgi:mono/diheme cytochrome c family protein